MPKGNEISIQERQLQTSQNMEMPGWRPNLQVSVLLASLTFISSITCKTLSTVVTWLTHLLNSLVWSQQPHSPSGTLLSSLFQNKEMHWLSTYLLPPASSPVPTSHSPPLHTPAQEVLFLVTGGKKWSDLAPSMGCPHPWWHLWLYIPVYWRQEWYDSIISVS